MDLDVDVYFCFLLSFLISVRSENLNLSMKKGEETINKYLIGLISISDLLLAYEFYQVYLNDLPLLLWLHKEEDHCQMA
jgi:hypothetical protein